MQLRKFILPLLMVSLGTTASYAEELTGSLKKIKDNGIIIVGYRESSIPFSYYGKKQEVIGYAQDYSNLIVSAIKTKLNLPNLQVKLLPITSQTRIPLLQNGSYDFECGSTTNNAARQRQADFSNSIFVVNTRLLVKKDSGITRVDDLKDKNVVVTAGTTSEVKLNQLNSEKNMGIRLIPAKDHNGAFRTLEMGRAVAFVIDDVLLASERAKARNPSDWIIVGEPLSHEVYGCMLRKDDPEFKKLIDDTIAQAQLSGEAEKSYQRWFMNPIPPKGLNLNFELSDDMKALFKAPNDKAYQ